MVEQTEKEDRNSNLWLFLDEAFIEHSPSRKQLMISQELKLREGIYNFVIRLGTTLKLSGGTILAATIYINRFYMRYPITTSKYFVACGALAISSKLNDTYRPPDKIALSACILKNPNKVIDEHSDIFWQWRDQLLYREELILKALNFELNVELPYSLKDLLIEADEIETSPDNVFNEKSKDILKIVVSSIELFSSLPVLIAYNMRTFFGTILVITIIEARQRFQLSENKILELPKNYLSKYIETNAYECWDCYQFMAKLLSHCNQKDVRLASHRNIIKKFPSIDRSTFFGILNDDSAT